MEVPDDLCNICLDSNDKKHVTLHCGHFFHTQCIQRWKNTNNNTCPTCRTTIVEQISPDTIIQSHLELFFKSSIDSFVQYNQSIDANQSTMNNIQFRIDVLNRMIESYQRKKAEAIDEEEKRDYQKRIEKYEEEKERELERQLYYWNEKKRNEQKMALSGLGIMLSGFMSHLNKEKEKEEEKN